MRYVTRNCRIYCKMFGNDTGHSSPVLAGSRDILYSRERREREEWVCGRSVMTPDFSKAEKKMSWRLLGFPPPLSAGTSPSSRHGTHLSCPRNRHSRLSPVSCARRVSRRGLRETTTACGRVMRARRHPQDRSREAMSVSSDARPDEFPSRNWQQNWDFFRRLLLTQGFWHSHFVHPFVSPRSSPRLTSYCSISLGCTESSCTRTLIPVPISLDSPRRSAGN